jgi:hypothetical protein
MLQTFLNVILDGVLSGRLFIIYLSCLFLFLCVNENKKKIVKYNNFLLLMAQPSVAAVQRLKKEYQSILKERPPFIQAHPHKDNLLTWHYAIEV